MKAEVYLMLPFAMLALAGCAQNGPSTPPAPSPKATQVGEAQSCIPLAQIRETRVRDDWTIDFVGGGDRVWRNTLPHRCTGLKSEDAFSYETSLSQLCSTDIIHVLRHTGGSLEKGAGCGLGAFVPVRLEK